jgi:hypothetical protein
MSQVRKLSTDGRQLASTDPSRVATVATGGRQITSTVPGGEADYRGEAANRYCPK